MAAPERGRTRWELLLPILAVPVIVLGALVAGIALFAFTGDEDGGRTDGGRKDGGRTDGGRTGAAAGVPCAEALAFGAAERPPGATVRDCTVQRGIDTSYSAVLRMPRADVRGWLRATYPDAPRPRTGGGVCGALCLDVTRENGLPGTAGAHVVQVRVEHENAETALVRFSAFTM
ncbi:hypothetical protein ACH4C6_15055 [Streptomyces sp. NPDC017943]|uniref:hypothetical protein n=1 Tax=Streptomyces sp. NPDC017943 TaxID=3365019 RepID=UPI0037A25065